MEEYLKILKNIENKKLDINILYILSCLELKYMNKKTIQKQTDYIYNIWKKSTIDLSLSKLCEVVKSVWGSIEEGRFSESDIIVFYFSCK